MLILYISSFKALITIINFCKIIYLTDDIPNFIREPDSGHLVAFSITYDVKMSISTKICKKRIFLHQL